MVDRTAIILSTTAGFIILIILMVIYMTGLKEDIKRFCGQGKPVAAKECVCEYEDEECPPCPECQMCGSVYVLLRDYAGEKAYVDAYFSITDFVDAQESKLSI